MEMRFRSLERRIKNLQGREEHIGRGYIGAQEAWEVGMVQKDSHKEGN